MIDYLIVGAGFSGCVAARQIAEVLQKRVLIVEKRSHIAGNAYDYYDCNHILVHKYGPHIFHTNSDKVWNFLSRFTSWIPYFHRTLASIDGALVPVPFNLNSLNALFPKHYAEKLEEILIQEYGFGAKIPILKLRESGNNELDFLAKYIYSNVFEGYTKKQWGFSPEELDASVTGRVPVFVSRDNRYFQDKYQGIPAQGYTAMFSRLIDHPNISVALNADYNSVMDSIQFDKMIYTGPIDAYFDYMHGELPYRSLLFVHQYAQQDLVQPTAQLNYPNEHLYTRSTEFKHITGQIAEGTTVAFEYPQPYIRGENEPYYPIPRPENNDLFKKYEQSAAAVKNTTFLGRLADYRYYDMHQVVARALSVFENIIAKQ